MTEARVRQIAEATGYRPNHVRRMLKAVETPDDFRHHYIRKTILKALDTPNDAVGLVHSAFGIPRSKAALIVRMAQEPDAAPEPELKPAWWKRLLPW